MALVDTLGNLVRFLLLPGQTHDLKGVAPLSKDISFEALLADKAFDADWLLQDLNARGVTAVIPPNASRDCKRRLRPAVCGFDLEPCCTPHEWLVFPVVSMGRRNTLLFLERWSVYNEVSHTDVLYGQAEV